MRRKRVGMTVLIILAVLAAGQVIGAWVTASMILHPARRSLAEAAEEVGYATPADLGLPWEEVSVPVEEGSIRGWLVRAEPNPRKTLVLIHGIGENRVGTLPLLPVLEPLGMNLVLIDLRAHGESAGECLTYGIREREDLKAVVDWLMAADLARPGSVGLMGLSLGGAVALQAAAVDQRVGAVIADGAYARLRPLIYREAWRVFPAAVLVTPLGIKLAEWRGGFSVAEANPVDVARQIRCPVLLIHGEADDVVPPRHARELKSALGERGELWLVPEARHCEALDLDQVDDVLGWVLETLGEHHERGVVGKYRVRLWGAGGKPMGSASTRYEAGDQAERAPKAPAPEPLEPDPPCSSCLALQVEVEQLRGRLQRTRAELHDSRSREQLFERGFREQEQRLYQLRTELRRLHDRREATTAELRKRKADAVLLQEDRDRLQRTCDEQAKQIVDLKAKVAVLLDQSAKILDTLPAWMLA